MFQRYVGLRLNLRSSTVLGNSRVIFVDVEHAVTSERYHSGVKFGEALLFLGRSVFDRLLRKMAKLLLFLTMT